MAAEAIRDRFANIASIETVETAANTLSFNSLSTNMGFLGRRDQALAMVIDELQWRPNMVALTQLLTTADRIRMALTVSNAVTDITDLTDRRILATHSWGLGFVGAATAAFIIQAPVNKQFFPPLITAERTLFLAVEGVSLTSAMTGQLRILFRVETLTSGELVELAEVFRLTS